MVTPDSIDTAPQPKNVAERIRNLRDSVFSRWELSIRAAILETKDLDSQALVNGLIRFYDDIALALINDSPYTASSPGHGSSFQHGRERATLTQYGPSDVVKEIQLLRQALFETAELYNITLDSRHRSIICRSFDAATLDAINCFFVAQKEIAETFITSLSHDLRNPLNIANVSAQLIEKKSDNSSVTEYAQRIRKKLAELDAMIQTLLDAAFLKGRKKLRLRIVQFDMMALANEVCDDMIMPNRPIIINGAPVVGYWCSTSIKRVFENLISNAQKYGQPNTPISVLIGSGDEGVVIEVHNEGTPVPAEDRHLLFSTFHRFEEVNVRGWGLGLPFVRLVTESHGGNVSVVSTPENGTTFRITMPLDCRAHET
ncbi:ATP-binding protein [Massilia sp. LC238]|uniref:ATP-binding protein n=1 Tax=Massilia sp. LC238 TaxID=1502852 RepID=UPI0004E42D49|nr:ATP-binding protein [Massilia sp. LC238]KFC62344.1 Signal transduction histidine kinase [Massilia sp. LC238]